MIEFKRGEIYYINFPYTFDVNYPSGKPKFVVVLQEGAIFNTRDSVVVLLITTDPESKDYGFNYTIPLGSTKLKYESYVLCSQPYTILKEIFNQEGVWKAGQLSSDALNAIDVRLHKGLCIGLQNKKKS